MKDGLAESLRIKSTVTPQHTPTPTPHTPHTKNKPSQLPLPIARALDKLTEDAGGYSTLILV